MLPRSQLIFSFLSLTCCLACRGPDGRIAELTGSTSRATVSNVELVGTWRAVLGSPGGELPFRLEIRDHEDEMTASAWTGTEETPFSSVRMEDKEVVLRFDWYDSEIRARLSANGDHLAGEWTKTVPRGLTRMPFEATKDDSRRFAPLSLAGGATETTSVTGHWAVEFIDDSGREPARGEFEQSESRVTGTFLTPTGDYRFLEGSFETGVLRLSTFDGAHAFLFEAQLEPSGELSGDFWSRDTYHASWTARRIDPDTRVLPDAWSIVGLTNDEGRFRFRFPDLEGRPVSLDDQRFKGKVVLVNIFGSWCPNCNDKAPLLAEWYRRYRDRGLEIIGLAYEFTGDIARDRRVVARYAERHGIEFPLLLAGLSDKGRAGETLPDLSAVVAFPTSVFIGRDGRVRRIHTGFSGPGTGEHYTELVSELEGSLQELLAEPA